MNPPPDDELVRHARALRGLARSLVGPQDADDLVQDTALQVLRRAPAGVRSWFSWFGGVMRKRAAKWHRSEGRRLRREQLAGGELDPAGSALRVAAHREAIARLDAALLALPEPYQGTLLLRYFEDLTPTAIAARSGESLATVKSRLQRGLELLRQRLAADERGRDWRGGLVTAFGLGRRSAVAGLVAAGVTTMVGKIVLGAAAAALAVVFLWPADAAPPPASAPTARVDAAAPAKGDLAANSERTEATPAPAPVLPTNAAAGEVLVVYVGRCVDEQGAPLADAKVTARCRKRDGGDVLRSDEQQSAADGTFCVRLPVAARAFHHLEVVSAERCGVENRFDGEKASERIDVGDVVVPVACTVRGRVVDRAGVPQPGVRVRLRPRWRASSSSWDFSDIEPVASSSNDGSLAFRVLPTGRYDVTAENRRLADGSTSRVELGQSARSLEIEVIVEPPPTLCRGIVVDESGAPIARASVQLDGESVQSASDGRFALTPNPNVTQPGSVSVDREGYLRREVAWRRDDAAELRIVLTAQPALTIRVVGTDGAPVTAFEARVVNPSMGWTQVRGEGKHHDGGICRLVVGPEDWRVFVKPLDEMLAPSAFVPVRVEPGRAADVTVVVAPWQQRRLVVTDGTKPIAGVRVELLDPSDLRVRRDTWTFELGDVKVGGLPFAAILQAGTTDADGVLPLRGPRGALALRLGGGAAALQVVQPVRLDEAGDLVVVAERAARWRGRLTPPDVAAALLATKAPPTRGQDGVGIELVAANGESLRRTYESRFPFAADGSFTIDGVPAGTWHVVVARFAAATITVRAGEQLTQDVDVRALAPADVTLRVRVDGKPAANTYVNVMGQHATGVNGERLGSQTMAGTDDVGCLSFRTYVGDLTLYIYLEQTRAASLFLVAAASVRAPGPQELVLDLQLGRLDLEVRTPDGAPAAELDLELSPAGGSRPLRVRTASDGTLRAAAFVGSYVIRVRPKHLGTQAARDEFARAHGYRALEEAWIPAGSIDVAPGAARPQRLTLPDAWAR